MEINLLPKRSVYEQYRFLILTVPSLLLLSLALTGFVKYIQLNSDITQVRGELVNVVSDNTSLQAERTTTTKTKLYNQIQSAVRNVQDGEHDYGVMLDGIAAKLSEKTRVTSAAMDADAQQVTLTLESDSIDNIADYAVLLRAEPWVKDVFVQDIENTTDDKKQQTTQKLSQKLTDSGVTVVNPPPDPGANQQQSYADQFKAEHPFKTQVVIALAPKDIPVKQSSK